MVCIVYALITTCYLWSTLHVEKTRNRKLAPFAGSAPSHFRLHNLKLLTRLRPRGRMCRFAIAFLKLLQYVYASFMRYIGVVQLPVVSLNFKRLGDSETRRLGDYSP